MDFLKSTVGKVVSGLVGLAVVAGIISWFTADVSTRQHILSDSGRIAAWFGIMLALPWATFAIIGRVARLESNRAGAVLVAVYTVLEVVLLAWLFHWQITGATEWSLLVLGGLVAGVYNLLACDWIAEKLA